MWNGSHSRISMVVGDDLVPIWNQDICNHCGQSVGAYREYRNVMLTHWGREKMAAISQPTLSAFSWTVGIPIKWSLKFVPKCSINNIPALVQIMAWHRPGDKPLSEPMMVRLVTHICAIRLPWVNHLTGHLAIPYCILLNAGIHWNENVILTKLSSKDQGFLYTCSWKSLTGYTESCQNHNFRFRRRKFRRNNQISFQCCTFTSEGILRCLRMLFAGPTAIKR